MTVEIQHSFDVLKTISQLPNDEAYTAPEVVNVMLDLLPEHVWSEPDFTWLDPAAKSGVFLREIAKRLMVGLTDWQPDETKRREHIYRNMLYGSATSQLSGEVARRTLYHSKDATGAGLLDDQLKDLIIRLDHPDGNIPFIDTEHEFIPGRRSCVRCGSAPDIERGPTRENYAYPFIHMTYPTEEMSEMKFDVIVGNPPYQLKGGGGGTNDSPIYQYFVERAVDMDPRYLVMITPSRWFTGGRGLDQFRERMVADRRLKHVVDNPKLFDVFPMVEIKGGVSYFLWDREHDDDCTVETRIDGELISKKTRDLRKGRGVLVRSNEAAPIVEKVIERGEPALEARISPDTPPSARSRVGLGQTRGRHQERRLDGRLQGVHPQGRRRTRSYPRCCTGPTGVHSA
jgi:site-specific DNA-methyltransferase (adenine-specific)